MIKFKSLNSICLKINIKMIPTTVQHSLSAAWGVGLELASINSGVSIENPAITVLGERLMILVSFLLCSSMNMSTKSLKNG